MDSPDEPDGNGEQVFDISMALTRTSHIPTQPNFTLGGGDRVHREDGGHRVGIGRPGGVRGDGAVGQEAVDGERIASDVDQVELFALEYFGDTVVWFALWGLALGHWVGLLTVVAPLVMMRLLTSFSGKALTEKGMRRSRGAAFDDYVARTSGFFPMPPRRRTSRAAVDA